MSAAHLSPGPETSMLHSYWYLCVLTLNQWQFLTNSLISPLFMFVQCPFSFAFAKVFSLPKWPLVRHSCSRRMKSALHAIRMTTTTGGLLLIHVKTSSLSTQGYLMSEEFHIFANVLSSYCSLISSSVMNTV